MQYFLTIITVIIGTFGFSNDDNKTRKIVGIILIIISGGGQIWSDVTEGNKEKYSRNTGKLISKAQIKDALPVFTLCKSQFVLKDKKNDVIYTIGEDPVTVRTKNGLALFSMTIRDANGDVLTSILDNEWVVYQDRVNDWNFSENILEVIDSKNDVLFQAELNGNEIRFAGKTYQKNGSGPISFVPLLARCDHGVDGTIFQYPRNRHHGEKKIYA